MIEIVIIILTMIILIGAVIAEELRTRSSNHPQKSLISKRPSKPSRGRSPGQSNT